MALHSKNKMMNLIILICKTGISIKTP